ncbi:MAG: hypothetical protein AAGN46_13820 [Acidobacteriota bacterium]
MLARTVSLPMCRLIRRLRPLAACLWLALGAPGGQAVVLAGDAIFADDFETGDTLAWNSAVGLVDCLDGPVPPDALAGDLGPAPAGALVACLELRNDRPVERAEIAFSSLPLPRALGLLDVSELVLVAPGGRRMAAQFDVVSRWAAPLADDSAPIRWLQVTAPADVAARLGAVDGVSRYELRRVSADTPPTDSFAVTVEENGAQITVDTGLATFALDATNPSLLEAVSIDLDDDGVGRVPLVLDGPGAGPRLVFVGPGGDVALGTATPGAVVVDDLEIVERGPAKAVVAMRGHFVDVGGASLCSTLGGSVVYERFGYTVVATFERGRRDIGLELHLRNECSDASTGPWTDEAVTVRSFTWTLPLQLTAPRRGWAGAGAAQIDATAGAVRVAQARGDDPGSGWTRRAAAVVDASVAETSEAFEVPWVAVRGTAGPAGFGAATGAVDVTVSAQTAWMRFREPMALSAAGSTLVVEPVAETLVLGEGKGLWTRHRIAIVPDGTRADFGLEGVRTRTALRLERGLVPWPGRDAIDAAGIFPSLGDDQPSTLRTHYRAWMERMHAELLGNAWESGKVYGSLRWPESGAADPFGVAAATPNDGWSSMNYWDAAGAEILEFLRSGEPRWLWDFALPGYWTQAHAAYLDIGDRTHGNRAGVAVTSGGPGCDQNGPVPCTADGTAGGHWHRSGFGSDDWTYAMSLELGYALRPTPALRHRLEQAGREMDDRYDVPRPQEAMRECFVNQVDLTRQVIQHVEMIANCAEFAPGAVGESCHDKLLELLDELAQDNLNGGLMCQRFEADCFGNPPPPATRCSTPQFFMQNALMFQFFHRAWRNYGDPPNGSIRDMLVELPRRLYQDAMPKLADGTSIDPGFGATCDPSDGDGCWWPRMECDLSTDQSQVLACTAARDSDANFFMAAHTRPHTVALMLLAHEIDPSVGLCALAEQVYAVDTFTGDPDDGQGNWNGVGHFVPIGWWKGTAQMMQGMAFAVGVSDTCD